MPLSSEILILIRRVALNLPPTTLKEVIQVLEAHGDEPCDNPLKQKLLIQTPTPGGRHLINSLISEWDKNGVKISANAIASALAMAAYGEKTAREELSVQLVWTGPTEDVPTRLTSQTLLQLIDDSKTDLLVISFAIYNIPEVVESLTKAVKRGVRLKIVAETPDESEGKLTFGALPTLGDMLIKQSQLYVWPKDKRPTDLQGRHGSLHVKCAVADEQVAYITSANLTGYAMQLNMEMGALIHSKEFARQVKDHIEGLIFKKVLVPINQ